jgi:hypothetical protein
VGKSPGSDTNQHQVREWGKQESGTTEYPMARVVAGFVERGLTSPSSERRHDAISCFHPEPHLASIICWRAYRSV